MAIFEAPVAHEAVHYSNLESNPEEEYEGLLGNIISGIGGLLGGGEVGEFEDEYEDEASPYSYPENPYSNLEEEWETHEGSLYTNSEEEYEGLFGNIISGIGSLLGGGEVGEFEDEASPYSYPEQEYEGLLGNIISGIGGLLGGGEVGEFEDEASPYSNLEADQFFRRIGRAIRRVSRVVAPIAKRLAPIAARSLVSMIPGVGMIAAPLAGKLVGSLVREAEVETAEMENQFVSTFAETGEVEHPEVQEALLSEIMAANAVGAQSEAEAEALIGATIPLSLKFMRAQRTLLPVTPTLVQANARLVRTLRRQGQVGRELLRLIPTINRLAAAILRRAARSQKLSTPLAVKAMAVATRRVMGNQRKVQKALQRNMALRVRTQGSPTRRVRTLRPLSLRRRRLAV